jgi:diaminohydroxyphosphoribosylaminopyrimidine deaminase/5-amino-6-(5-phosphoribosylamino)uracil reductase
MVIDKNFYMSLAIKEAWKYQGLTYPNPAVGCCVVGKHGEILSVEAHKKAGTPHAEVNALKAAYLKLTNDEALLHVEDSAEIHQFLIENHKDIFQDCSIYTTLEPCSKIAKTPACSNFIKKLNIKKVYIGSSDLYQDDFSGAEFGVMTKECDALLKPFELWQKDKFVFFKWAQRLDGSTDGEVSTLKSRTNVHAMRDVCDLLVIGGNTVREDRPTLDARLVGGKAPDILIYSRQTEFDTTIPLFNVKGRKVMISDSLEIINGYKNIMIEGTSKMMELTKDVVNMYLCYLHVEDKFESLNVEKEDQDIISWLK